MAACAIRRPGMRRCNGSCELNRGGSGLLVFLGFFADFFAGVGDILAGAVNGVARRQKC